MNFQVRSWLAVLAIALVACGPSTERIEQDARSFYAEYPPMGLHRGDTTTITTLSVVGTRKDGAAFSALVSAAGTTRCIFPDIPLRPWREQRWFNYQRLGTGWFLIQQ